MNGQEMMLNALVKMLGIDPQVFMAQGQKFIGEVAALKVQVDRIEAQQLEILSLLRGDMPIVIPAQTEDRKEA